MPQDPISGMLARYNTIWFQTWQPMTFIIGIPADGGSSLWYTEYIWDGQGRSLLDLFREVHSKFVLGCTVRLDVVGFTRSDVERCLLQAAQSITLFHKFCIISSEPISGTIRVALT